MHEVVNYNLSRAANEQFDGVMLDVESGPVTEADFQALISHYECMRNHLTGGPIKLGAAISAFWDDDPVTYPAPPMPGTVKMASEHIIDLPLDSIVVMGYRDTAGTDTCPTSDGMICLDKAEIAYATAIGKQGLVSVGLETINPASVGILNKETFYEEGEASLISQAALVDTYFSPSLGFGGFAIHDYTKAYLSGTALWPSLAPTAASHSISGRVSTPDGSGIRGVLVTVSGGQLAETVSVITGTFGYYRINDITAGRTYVVTVAARKYQFDQPNRIVTLSEDIAGLDFVSVR
jgi:hypothetical protein